MVALVAGGQLAGWVPASAAISDSREPISFPDWKTALARADVLPDRREQYRRAILALLKRCKDERTPVSVALIRRHLAGTQEPGARDALRWFYQTARRMQTGEPGLVQGAHTRPGAPQPAFCPRSAGPPLAASDRGGPNWERDLIAAARERGFLWRRVNGFANAA